MIEERWLFWTSVGLTIGFAMAFYCFNKLAKRVPINYICLTIFTVCSTYMIAAISSYQPAENVLIASALTFAMFIGLTVLTFFV